MDRRLERIYSSTTDSEKRDSYNAWASDYERDVFEFGIRMQINAAAAFVAHVPEKLGPFLDAACGTGLQVESLHLVGYGPFTGIDISDGMLEVAKQKDIYDQLELATLGDRLRFDDDTFAATLCIGALSYAHAPPQSFTELTRVTRPGGHIVVTLRLDEHTESYLAAIHDIEAKGDLRIAFMSEPFASMPYADATIEHTICVLEVLG